MNTKDFSKMAILDQSVLQKAEKGRFVVDKDYNLNGARLVVPNGMTIDFNGHYEQQRYLYIHYRRCRQFESY